MSVSTACSNGPVATFRNSTLVTSQYARYTLSDKNTKAYASRWSSKGPGDLS